MKGKGFYIRTRSGLWNPVKGYCIRWARTKELDLFCHKGDTMWIVSEGKTGAYIEGYHGETKRDLLADFKRGVELYDEQNGEGAFVKKVKAKIEHLNNVSPRYTEIKP